MGVLGDCFPKDFIADIAVSNGITVGDVLHLYCEFTTPEKYKYLVVCCTNPLLVLCINSEINEYIKCRPELLACQVDVPETDHPFLKWDSVVNCVEASDSFDITELSEKIVSDYYKIIKGRIEDYCMRNIYIAVSISPTMKRKHKKAILTALSSYN